MITAIDTSILLDVFAADPVFGAQSRELVRRCMAEGRLVACAVVWSEVAGFFPSARAVEEAMGQLGVAYAGVDRAAALLAGATWKQYRRRGGKRERMVPDFLIGAHAQAEADRLLARDRGFYRTYFSQLPVIAPSTAP